MILYLYINTHTSVVNSNRMLFVCSFLRMFYILLMYQFHVLSHPHVGILPPPKQFSMNVSNSTSDLSWVAPDSLQVSTPPTISHYVLSNNLTNGTKTFNNPTTCNPLAFCTYSLDLRDPFFTCVGCYGGENMTILDYNGTILFTFFAVNGAGNGNATTFMYVPPRSIPRG